MCESFRILCALCRVGLYSLYRRLCCKGPQPIRPNFSILCIGLEGAGKSSILATLSGDDFHNIEPTIGFSIKALLFPNCILDVKELGGGDQVRPYWERYYQTFQGIIFVIDGSAEQDKLQISRTELLKAIKHKQLSHIPLLILVTSKNSINTHCNQDITGFLEAEEEFKDRQWMIKNCITSDKESLNEIFNEFNAILLMNLEREIESKKSASSPSRSQNYKL